MESRNRKADRFDVLSRVISFRPIRPFIRILSADSLSFNRWYAFPIGFPLRPRFSEILPRSAEGFSLLAAIVRVKPTERSGVSRDE